MDPIDPGIGKNGIMIPGLRKHPELKQLPENRMRMANGRGAGIVIVP